MSDWATQRYCFQTQAYKWWERMGKHDRAGDGCRKASWQPWWAPSRRRFQGLLTPQVCLEVNSGVISLAPSFQSFKMLREVTEQ